MKQFIRLKVYLNHCANKPVFERLIEYDDSLIMPFNDLCSVMRFLYGSDCVVSFDVRPYDRQK